MWWKDGIIYQIYPRSFKDTNNDGIGDLNGIIEKLDYLNDGTENSLGVDAIWISPFFKSPMKDFGYDISDYKNIDPIFGTLEDFEKLLSETHKRNMKLIIDLVMNHTSDEHPWFQESRKNRDNPKADWYIWHPGINGKRPNNWFAALELKNAWWYEPKRKEFYLGTFTRHQPELNWRNPEVKETMLDIVRYWLDKGVDGLRLDVINWFFKDEALRSNPHTFDSIDFQKHIYDRNLPESITLCKELRKLTDSYDERMMVGEVYTNDSKKAAEYYGENNDALHMAFNFNFLFQPWDAEKIYKTIIEWYELLPKDAWPNFTFSNHDNLRHYYRYRKKGWSDERPKVTAALLMSLKGTPFVYYGEEIGMTGGKLKRKDLQDPCSIHTWPIKKYCRDLARTPMQWDNSLFAGFSNNTPWLPVNENYYQRNVKSQSEDRNSILSFYKKLIWFRKNHAVLQKGKIRFFPDLLPEVMAYIRSDEETEMLVLLNFSDKKVILKDKIDVNNYMPFSIGKAIFTFTKELESKLTISELSLEPYEVLLLKKEEQL